MMAVLLIYKPRLSFVINPNPNRMYDGMTGRKMCNWKSHELTQKCVTVPGDPQDVKARPINSTSIHVTWQPPKVKDQNGVILGYQVHVQEVGSEVSFGACKLCGSIFLLIYTWAWLCPQGKDLLNEPILRDVKQKDASELNVTDLQPDTQYSVQVAGLTRKGDGQRSLPVVVRTPGGVPNKPSINVK